MQGGTKSERPSSASLAPVAVIVAAMLVLALVVSGVVWKTTTGTVVVQRITLSSTALTHGKSHPSPRYVLNELIESSSSAALQRTFVTDSFVRPGYEQVLAGDAMRLYDPADNTIYVTTSGALQRATVAHMKLGAPKGSSVSVGTVQSSSPTAQSVPGRTSVFLQQLRAGNLRVAGRTTIDDRPAVRLVRSKLAHTEPLGGESKITAYVSPGTYDPIREIVTHSLRVDTGG